ncbi:MAG TPA: phosphoribosylglycinamide formyltransferase [Dongiaceae bacterium]|nr:phosphoribosylglycinamide formyltransferase [Dongiaceae bacterium]
MTEKLRLAVLISGRGSNLQAILDAFGPHVSGSPIEIVLVLSNRPDAAGLTRAEQAGVPTAIIDHKQFPDRASFDAAMDAKIRATGANFIALAGFMRLLTDGFIDAWRDHMINIHPAILPALKGLHTHERAIKRGLKLHGCTVHFVRPEMDTGPIIAQAAVPVLAGDTPDLLADRVLAAEHRLYPQALRLIAAGKVRVEGEVAVVEQAGDATAYLVNPAPAAGPSPTRHR